MSSKTPIKYSFDVLSATTHDCWRTFKIMSEVVEGFESLSTMENCISIFGSARAPKTSKIYHETETISRKLVEEGYSIITGGGPGLMEAGNKGATEAGGESIGLHIHLPHEQSCNPYVKTRLDFRYFFTRKLMFVKYASAYIVMPGGMGTIDELSEAFVLVQTQRIKPVPIILYDGKFWGGFLDWIKTSMADDGYIRKEELDLMAICNTPEEVIEYVKKTAPKSPSCTL